MIINPTEFTWDGATTRVDSSTYDASQRKGYDLAIKPTGAPDSDFNIIMGVISNSQSFVAPISDLANPIEAGNWTAGVREVDINGITSDWAQLEFVIAVEPSIPVNFTAS